MINDIIEEEKFERKCYELYQLDWLMTHGHSLQDVFKVLREGYIENCSSGNIDGGTNCDEDFDAMEEYFKEQGFNGEIFACEEEFYDNEYQDKDYMMHLLPEDMLEQYNNYQTVKED